MNPDTIAEIFSLLDVAPLRVGTQYTIDITDRVRVTFLKNGGKWYADLRLDDLSVSMDPEDRAAFVKWWTDNHKQKIAKNMAIIEESIEHALEFYGEQPLRIEDY